MRFDNWHMTDGLRAPYRGAPLYFYTNLENVYNVQTID
jgi:hypothetical protein